VNGRTNVKNEVDHIDGNKNNNKPSNLEWVTRTENVRRGFANGLIPIMRGSRNGNTNLDEESVRTICMLLVYYCGNCIKTFHTIPIFGVKTNIGRIHDIKYKKIWSWISDEYFTRESISEIDRISDEHVSLICEYLILDDCDIDGVYDDLVSEGIVIDKNIIRNIRDGNARTGVSHKIFKKHGLKL